MAEAHKQETEIISEKDKNELEGAFKKGGVEELQNVLKSKCEEWKTIPVNIAVTGESGVGKSSLINTLRNLTADDEEGAEANVKEATREIHEYKHPNNENIVFSDLPGVGTPKFPQEDYLEAVKFDRYDFFLVLSVGRVREADMWLCNEVNKRRKKFYFVRTQMGLEVIKDSKSHPLTHKKKKVIQTIRNDCEENLKKEKLPSDRIFLIDSYEIDDEDFDFERLSTSIINELPNEKREAWTLSVTTLTRGIIEEKKRILGSRIYKVALLSAVGGAVPIPGVHSVFDAALVKAEIEEYRKQFGLTSIKHIGRSPFEFMQNFIVDNSPATVAHYIASITTNEDIVSKMKSSFAIRLFGSLAGAAISYGKTVFALRKVLDMCTDDVHELSKEMVNEFAPNI